MNAEPHPPPEPVPGPQPAPPGPEVIKPPPPRSRAAARAPQPVPLPVTWLAGLALGALGGVGLLLWEGAVIQAAGLPFAQQGTLGTLLVGYAAGGALLGGIASASGLWGPRWALASSVLLASWFASVKLAALASFVGLSPAVGVGLALVLGGIGGQVLGRMPGPGWLHLGLAAWGLCGLALLAPLHLHLVDGMDLAVLLTSGVALLIAGALALFTAAFTTHNGLPWVPLLAWGLLGAGGVGVTRAHPAAEPVPPVSKARGPSLVVVVVSGLRFDRLGYGGDTRRLTPSLDRLAARSLAFTGAHATSNWSVPSIGSVLTGRLPYAHGAGLNDGARTTNSALAPGTPTLAGTLRRSGWATAGVSGDPELRTFGLDAGFEHWQDAPAQGLLPALLAPLSVAGLDPLAWPRHVDAELVTDRALALLEAQAPHMGSLLFVHYADAAGPFRPTPEDQAEVGYTTRPFPVDRYDAAVHRVDRAIGRLIEAVPDDAWVVVVGDRGVHLTEERPRDRQARAGMRFGHTMYEELLHVPLLLRAPNMAPARAAGIVSVVDLAPTLLAAVGHRPLPRADGAPLERAFGAGSGDRIAIAQSSRFGVEQQAVILGRHKLIHTADGRTPMFDLRSDPNEVTALPADAEHEQLERRLLGVLPPPGAGVRLQPPPPLLLRMGQIGTRLIGRR